MVRFALLTLFTLLFAALVAQAPVLDPAVKTGTLPNGIRYFLMNNPRPENRVEMRLVRGRARPKDDSTTVAPSS